jgi:hypothetical protein
MEYSNLMEAVADRLPLGEFNKPMSSREQLRYGTKGSLSVDIKKGTFFDYEAGQGGGVLDLIKRYGHNIRKSRQAGVSNIVSPRWAPA